MQTGSPPVLRRQRVVLPVPQFAHTVPLRFTVVCVRHRHKFTLCSVFNVLVHDATYSARGTNKVFSG